MTEFEEIYRAYFKDVYLFIKNMSNDEHVAEDITSETFMKAMKSINSFEGKCDIRVWLCQISKNCYFSYLRKNKKLTDIDMLPEQTEDFNIEQSIYSADASRKIHEILHNLDEPYKEVFSLRIFGELSFKQIGSLFEKNENWACVTYHRARKKIKAQMEDC